MSTVIYGDRIVGGAASAPLIHEFVVAIRQMAVAAQEKQNASLRDAYLRMLITAADEATCFPKTPRCTISEIQEKMETLMRVSKTTRGVMFDHALEICWTLHKNDILYIPFGCRQDIEWVRERLGSEDFSYDTRVGPAEGVSWEEHNLRGDAWESVLAPSMKPSSLFVCTLAEMPLSLPFHVWGKSLYDGAPTLLTRLERAQRVADENPEVPLEEILLRIPETVTKEYLIQGPLSMKLP